MGKDSQTVSFEGTERSGVEILQFDADCSTVPEWFSTSQERWVRARWHYYFTYCETGFRRKHIDVWQLLWSIGDGMSQPIEWGQKREGLLPRSAKNGLRYLPFLTHTKLFYHELSKVLWTRHQGFALKKIPALLMFGPLSESGSGSLWDLTALSHAGIVDNELGPASG